ncbi:MAG TPA: hypothetical protein VGC79_22050 [Polyangiaceae bacterium]
MDVDLLVSDPDDHSYVGLPVYRLDPHDDPVDVETESFEGRSEFGADLAGVDCLHENLAPPAYPRGPAPEHR